MGSVGWEWSWRRLVRGGKAAVKETENERVVREIWSCHVARWKVRVAMDDGRQKVLLIGFGGLKVPI